GSRAPRPRRSTTRAAPWSWPHRWPTSSVRLPIRAAPSSVNGTTASRSPATRSTRSSPASTARSSATSPWTDAPEGLTLEAFVGESADDLAVGRALERLHDLADQRLLLLRLHLVVAVAPVLDDVGIRGEHLVHDRRERALVAHLGEPLLFD